MIDLSYMNVSQSGRVKMFCTVVQECTRIVPPDWAVSCTVAAAEGEIWIITNPLITDGMTVASSLLAGEVLTPGGGTAEISLSTGRLCSGVEQAEPSGEPTGCWFEITFFAS